MFIGLHHENEWTSKNICSSTSSNELMIIILSFMRMRRFVEKPQMKHKMPSMAQCYKIIGGCGRLNCDVGDTMTDTRLWYVGHRLNPNPTENIYFELLLLHLMTFLLFFSLHFCSSIFIYIHSYIVFRYAHTQRSPLDVNNAWEFSFLFRIYHFCYDDAAEYIGSVILMYTTFIQ